MIESEAYEILVNAYIKLAENPNIKILVSHEIIKAEEVYGKEKAKELFEKVVAGIERERKAGLL